MSVRKKVSKARDRRRCRVHNKIRRSGGVRVVVFRSLNHLYGQVIDDQNGTTVASCSTLVLKGLSGTKTEVARAVGVELAKRAQEKNVAKVNFDRGRFLYHGRVKAFAEGLREGGLSL